MVDAGGRAASVTIHRVMDTEHGLGNVTGEIMLATLLNHWVKYSGKPDIVRTDPEGAFRDQGFRRGLAAKSICLGIDILGTRPGKQECLGKPLIQIKQSAVRVARTTPDNVSIQEIFDECTTSHNDLHRNRGFSPWQFLWGKTPTDKTACEYPDLAHCSVEVVDEAANKAYIEEELSLRKRRREFHQARLWRHWAAGEWCWYWRSGKHKGSRMKGGAFLGPARVFFQERETNAEGVRVKGLSGSPRVLVLFDVLYSTCVPFPSPRKDCAASQTQKPSVSKTLSDVCHTVHFLISRHRQMLLMMLGKKKSLVGTHEAHEIQAEAVLSGRINLMQRHVWDPI